MGAGGAASAVSYWSLGQYDAVIHRALKTQIAPRAAARAGILAIAISQTVGFGLISGALVRWRMTAGLSLAQASTITASVAASFLLGWAAITGAVLLALPLPWKAGWERASRLRAGMAAARPRAWASHWE